MDERRFPLLYQGRAEEPLRERLPNVPWEFLAPHEAQALRFHTQTIKRLAERGGLGPSEMLAVVEDRNYQRMEESRAVDVLLVLVADWERTHNQAPGLTDVDVAVAKEREACAEVARSLIRRADADPVTAIMACNAIHARGKVGT